MDNLARAGIEGHAMISTMNAVSHEYPLPESIKEKGHIMVKKYIDIRIAEIETHNEQIKENVMMEAQEFKLLENCRI